MGGFSFFVWFLKHQLQPELNLPRRRMPAQARNCPKTGRTDIPIRIPERKRIGQINRLATMFKNFPIKSESRSVQFRWEFYNLFNHTQFNAMNTTATFN